MYTVIEGVYYVVGLSPDADSIKFKAANPAHWRKVQTDNRERFEKVLADDEGVVTIRLEGIDALETHYNPPSVRIPSNLTSKAKGIKRPQKGNHKQPERLGQQSTDIFLKFMGCTDVKWKKWGKNTWIDHATISGTVVDEKYMDAIPGYVVVDDIERNGRPLGWVFTGKPPVKDGTSLDKHAVGEMIAQSANYHLVARGTVYPFFYMTVPGALRIPLTQAAQKAQQNPDQDDVWLHDRTREGIEIPSLDALHTDAVIYPYLFRRIVRLWHSNTVQQWCDGIENGKTLLPDGKDLTLNLDNFFEESDPWIFVASEQDFVHLSDVLEVGTHSLKLRVYPYDIVFLS